ncbi:MAG TPA: hypothetical protein VGF84_00870 [Micromonosporaceae bacterium]|jgi:hypothetical protein
MREIRDAAAARALTLGDMAVYLQPFVHREASVAEAARELAEPIQRVHHRVLRLLRLGLIEITTVESRAGRPIKRYRSTAEAYRIPAHLLPEQLFPLGEANRSAFLQRALEAARPELVHDADIRITFPLDGSVNVDRDMGENLTAMLGDLAPAVLHTWRNLYLDPADAKRMQRELWDLVDRYAAPNENGRRYVLQLSMAPVPPEIDQGARNTRRR